MAVNRSWDSNYLQKQYEAMEWLVDQGMSLDEIRLMRWGSVDESNKTITLNKKMTILKADMKNPGLVKRDEYDKTFTVPLRGTKCEWFFLHSGIYCVWMFTREKPLYTQREKSRPSLFTSDEIKRALEARRKLVENSTINALTNDDLFANIEVSKANITKMKTAELERKAIEMQV